MNERQISGCSPRIRTVLEDEIDLIIRVSGYLSYNPDFPFYVVEGSLKVLEDDLDFDLLVTRTQSPMCKVLMSTEFSSTASDVDCLLARLFAAVSGTGIATAVAMLIGWAT